MKRAYYVIDVFTAKPFAGNPAAVVLDTAGLDEDVMQTIAAEFNLSETTFVLSPSKPDPAADAEPDDVSVRFRWFTPTMEVDMCGHATIAGVRALAESGRVRRPNQSESVRVRIETKSGWLTAFLELLPGTSENPMIWLDLVDPTLTTHPLNQTELAAVLHLPVSAFQDSIPIVESQDRDVLVFVRDTQALNEARPDFVLLDKFLRREGLRGMSLATTQTLTPSIHVQSRFFAPTAGVNEDPVTGSVHGPLSVFLVQQGLVPVHEDLSAVTCVQSKAGGRAGLLHALVQPKGDGVFSVRIGGQTVPSMSGLLRVG